jgi:hypothetical protein
VAIAQQLFHFLKQLQEFLGLPVFVQTSLLVQPALPDVHPGIIMPVVPGVGIGACLPLFEFLILFVARSAERVGRCRPGIGVRFHIYLRTALGTFQQTTGTLKDLLKSVNLALANLFVANGFEVLSLLAELDDIAHGVTFFSFFNDF